MTSPPRLRSLATGMTVGLLLFCGLTGCGSDDDTQDDTGTDTSAPLKVGSVGPPHTDILTYVDDNLAEAAGIDIEIVEFADYVLPNTALQDEEIDANYFQSVIYLEQNSPAAGWDFVNIGGVHVEPMGIYSDKVEDIADLPQGGTVAIPNEPSNGGRALDLLEANGLVTLADTGEAAPSINDIETNPKDLDIVEIEPAQLPRSLPDVDAAVINGNYAIEANLNPAEDALALESAEGNPDVVNILVSRQDNQDDPRIQKLIELLQGPEVVEFIQTTWPNGAVIPAT